MRGHGPELSQERLSSDAEEIPPWKGLVLLESPSLEGFKPILGTWVVLAVLGSVPKGFCSLGGAELTESFLRERSFFIFPPAARMLTLFSPPRYPRQLEEPQKHFWASLLWGDTKGASTTAQPHPQPPLHLQQPGMGTALCGKAK